MTKKMKCIKAYPMCGCEIPINTILEQMESNKPGRSIFKDENGNEFYFDNSEIIFSPEFQKSFIGIE